MVQITAIDVSTVAERFWGILRPFTLVHAPLYDRKFRSHFGCTCQEAALLWNLIDSSIESLNANHILWLLCALHLLHAYPTMDILATKMDRHKDTVRKHVWQFVHYLATLDVVSDYVPSFWCKLHPV